MAAALDIQSLIKIGTPECENLPKLQREKEISPEELLKKITFYGDQLKQWSSRIVKGKLRGEIAAYQEFKGAFLSAAVSADIALRTAESVRFGACENSKTDPRLQPYFNFLGEDPLNLPLKPRGVQPPRKLSLESIDEESKGYNSKKD